jgi:hypothetical protein
VIIAHKPLRCLPRPSAHFLPSFSTASNITTLHCHFTTPASPLLSITSAHFSSPRIGGAAASPLGVSPLSFGIFSPTRRRFTPISHYPLSFHIVLHSFVPRKKLSPLFSSKSKLFLQNTRGGITLEWRTRPPGFQTRWPAFPFQGPYTPFQGLYAPSQSSAYAPTASPGISRPKKRRLRLPVQRSTFDFQPLFTHYSLLTTHSLRKQSAILELAS